MSLAPKTEFVPRGDAHLAYQVFGEGPSDIVYIQGHASHLEQLWQWPLQVRQLELISRLGRVVMYDGRGYGMSDRLPDGGYSIEEFAADALAVWDAAGFERAVVFGDGPGAAVAVWLAVHHTERDAISFYDLALQALDLLEPVDDARRCAVLSERSPALHAVGRFEDETASVREAVAIALTHRWGDELAVAVMRLGNEPRAQVDPMVLEGVTKALELLPNDALARRAELLSFRASYAVMTPFGNPDLDRIDALSTEAVELARQAGDPAAIANALIGRFHALRQHGPLLELLAIAEEIEHQFRAAGRDYDSREGTYRRLRPLFELGRRDEFDDALTDFEATSLMWQSGHAQVRSMLALAEGRLDAAMQHARADIRDQSEVGRNQQFDQALAVRWARGDTDGALRQLAAGVRVAGDDFPALRSQHVACLAALGRDDEARAELGPISDWEPRLAERDARRMLRDLAEIAIRLDDAGLAEWLLPYAIPYDATVLTSYDLNTCDGAAAVTIAHCETALDRFDEAEAHYQAGIALETSIRAWGLIPNSQIFYARMCQARNALGDKERATALLNQASSAADQLGMRRIAEEARSLLDH